MEHVCPQCGARQEQRELGDMLVGKCVSCGHEVSVAMMARVFPELGRSAPVTLVVRVSGEVNPHALKKLRAGLTSLAPLNTAEVVQRLRSEAGLRLPNLRAGPTRQLVGELRDSGFVAEIEGNEG